MKPNRHLACLAPFFCALSAPLAHAAADTWVGNTSADWNNAANWNPAALPVTGDSFIFGAAGTSGTTLGNTFAAGFNVAGITFNSGAAAFTMAGNAITLSGDITNNSTAAQTINEAITLSGIRTVTTTTGGGNVTLGGVLSGAGAGLTVAGTGTVNLSAQSTYTGNTIINSGATLSLNGGGGSSGTIRGTATVNTGGTLRLNTADATGYNGGATALTAINLVGGTLNVNTPTANQTLGSAVITMTGGSITGVAGSNLDFFNGASAITTLASATTSTIAGTKINLRQNDGVTFNVAQGTTASGYDLEISSVISSAAGFNNNNLIKTGAGTMRLQGANTYSGTTTISAGTLNLSNTLALQGSTLNYSTGTLVFDQSVATNAFTLGGLSGTQGIALQNNAGGPAAIALTVGGNNATTAYSGALSGGGSLIKSGTGTLTLSGANTYAGATTVAGGGLKLDYTTNNSSKVSPTSGLTLAGANLEFAGNASATTSQAIGGLALSGVNTMTLATQTGQAITADFTANGGVFSRTATSSLNVATSGGGTAQVKLGIAPSTAFVSWATYNTTFAGTDASGYLIAASTANNSASDLSTWATGATQYITTGAAFTNSVNNGVVIDGITFNDAAARTVAIGAANTLTLNQGVVVTAAVGNNASVISGGLLQGSASSGVLNLSNNDTSSNLTVASVIQDNGGTATSLVKYGPGTVVLGSANADTANTYSGGTTVNGGTLYIHAGTAAGAKTALGTGAVTVNNATLQLHAPSTGNAQSYANALNLNNGTLVSDDAVVTYSGLVNLTGANSITVNWDNKGATFTNVISGAGSLTVNTGGSRLTLSGANNYTGGTTISSGLLSFANGSLGTTGTITMNGGTLQWNGTNTQDISARLAMVAGKTATFDTNGNNVTIASAVGNATTAALTKAGTGTLTLTAANTYTGATTVNAGTLSLGNGALGSATGLGTGAVTVNTGGTLQFWVNTGTGGTTFANNITLNGGTLLSQDGVNNLSGTVAIGASGGTFKSQWSNKNLVLTGVISGAGAVTIDRLAGDGGSRVLFQNTGNTFTGNITINGGTLATNNAQGNNTTGQLGANNIATRTITVNNGGTLSVAGNNLFGNGTQTLANTPTLIINAGGTVTTSNFNVLGNVTLNGGTLNATANSNGTTYLSYEFNGGTVTVGGTAASTISSSAGVGMHLAGGKTSTFNVGTTGAIGGDLLVSAPLSNGSGDRSGIGALTKIGAGTMVLSGINTYTGATTVTAGALRVNGSTAAGSTVSVAAGAILGGSGTIGGTLNVTGALAPGSSIESLITGGGVIMNSGSSLAIEIQDATALGADLLAITGDLTLNGTVTLDLTKLGAGTWSANDKLTLASYTGALVGGGLFSVGGVAVVDGGLFTTADNQSWTLDYNDTVKGNNFASDANGTYVTMTAVPEPATLLLGGLGLLALLRRRRER